MVIDSFIFNDELDLLELRLGQLDEVVDRFVFAESRRTFMDAPKPLYYSENKSRFDKWNHKITCIVPELPPYGSWDFEREFREALVPAIYGLNPNENDTLSFSDLDEIPNPEVVKSYTPDLGLRNLLQYTFYYNFNHMFNYGQRAWSRARIGVVGDIKRREGICSFRGGPGDMDPNWPSIENGGWHCSYFSDNLDRLRRKVYAISHDDLHPYIKSRTDRQIADDVVNGRDLYHRSGIGDAQRWETDDPRLPSYFLQNKERFKVFTNEYFVEKNRNLLE
jgi:beta-1,4-mannosyl-glycoprotein beta-1,4-N-acetylglucosaminyltransferase